MLTASLRQDRRFALSVLADVLCVLRNGRPSLVLALAHTHRLLRSALTAARGPPTAPGGVAGGSPRASSKPAGLQGAQGGARSSPRAAASQARAPAAGEDKAARSALAAAERKLWFLLVWSNEWSAQQLDMASGALEAELRELKASAGDGAVERPARPGEVRTR